MNSQNNKKQRKGKKNWRKNIDMEEVHEGVIEHNKQKVQKEEYEKLKKKIEKEEANKLFTIDDGSKDIKKRTPLDPNRFKKKTKEIVPLKADLKLVNKLIRKGKTNGPVEVNEEKDNLEWNQSFEGEVKYKHRVPSNHIAAVVMPHEGQSYNPSYTSHQQLLDSIVQKEYDANTIKVFGSRKHNKLLNHSKKVKKVKNTKHQKVLEQQQERKKAKEVKNQVSQMKVILKEIDLKNQQIREQHQITAEKAELRKNNEKKGIVEKSKYGKHRYEMGEKEFQLESELCENLRRLNPGNDLNIKERFDTVYRTKMLEKNTPWKAKVKPRVPRYKVTDLNRRRDDKEDEQLGNFQDKLDYKTL